MWRPLLFMLRCNPSEPIQAKVFVNHDNITDIATYLRQFGPLLAERILETYPPLQSTKDPVAPALAALLRKALPAQALAITGTAKYLRQAKAARIVAECGAGKTYMALGTIHVLAEGRPSTTLVMCPSHITHKWAREVLLTIPRARAFLIEDMRNGGDPGRPHGICEVKLTKLRYTNSAFGTKDRALQSCSPEIMSLSLLRNIPGSLRPR
jgi:hypothetical protein